MAKKKAKKVVSKSSVSRKGASGDLFKDHPNLVWLLPALFIIFAFVMYMQNTASY